MTKNNDIMQDTLYFQQEIKLNKQPNQLKLMNQTFDRNIFGSISNIDNLSK